MNKHLNRRAVLKTGVATVAATALTSLSTSTVSAPGRGGTLRMGVAGANTSDSWDGRTHSDSFMIVHGHGVVFDCLTEVTAKGELIGELAESWTSSPDARVWTFDLRKDVTFHNGKPFGADDVLASLQMHTAEGAKSAAKPIVEPIVKMKKLGEHQVEFTLASGNADFPYLMSDYHVLMYPAGMIEQAIAEGIGTGLYRVENFDPGVRFVGSRVEGHYKDGKAGWFDGIETIAINDSSARMNALLTGEVDVVNRVDFKIEALLRANPDVEIFEVTGNQHFTFAMRTDTDPFSDINVRKALKHAIDRQEMVDKILLGHGAIGNDHPIGPANQYYHDQLEQLEYDPEKAKFYLKEAGMASLDVDLSASEAAFPGAVDAAQLYQASAKVAGIEVNVVQESADGYWSNVWLKKPWSAVYWSGRATEDWMFSTNYELGVPWNDTFWENARFQELLLLGRAELDSDKRRSIYHEMQAIVSAEGGTIVPMYANYVDANSTRVTHGPDIGNLWQLDGSRIAERWWVA